MPAASLRDATLRSANGWALFPRALASLGVASAAATFTELQRPWRWSSSGPQLSRRAREILGDMLELPNIVQRSRSADGSTKLLLALGQDLVEAVHMPRAVGAGRVTLCVSSQVGCAMGCTFCATASMGFVRQLSAGEIVSQILCVLHALGPRHPSQLTLVFMGMGEPLHNLSEVARALDVLCEPAGLGLSARRTTVSTSGLVPQIEELARLEQRPLLAVSLNATSDETREQIMPIGKRYPLAELRAALTRYPLRARERITLEYVLLAGVNDTPADAARLADFGSSFAHQINLIPFNEHAHAPFRAPSEAALDGFVRAIGARARRLVTVRRSRGRDVQAACGQLVQARRSRA